MRVQGGSEFNSISEMKTFIEAFIDYSLLCDNTLYGVLLIVIYLLFYLLPM